jgi:hypothetical protein
LWLLLPLLPSLLQVLLLLVPLLVPLLLWWWWCGTSRDRSHGPKINHKSCDLLRVGSNNLGKKNRKSFEPTLNKSHDLWFRAHPPTTLGLGK